MAEAIEELKSKSGTSPALEAYAAYLDKLKKQGDPDKSGVVVDAVAVKPDGERTSLGYLRQRVAALKVEVARLNEKASSSTANAGKADAESQELERQATVASGQAIDERMAANRAQIEASAEEDKAASLQRQAEEAEAASKSARREADLLRTQGEREVARSQVDGNSEGYQRGMRLLGQAGEREQVVSGKSFEASSLQASSRQRRQNASDAQSRYKSSDAAATDSDRRARSLKQDSAGKQNEANRHKADAVASRQAANDRTLEQELLEKKVDELVEMASQIEFIVAS